MNVGVAPSPTTTSQVRLAVLASAPRKNFRPTESEWDPLARAAAGGDEQAKHDLLTQLAPKIERFCLSRIGGRDVSYLSAADITQEVCIALLHALPAYEDRGGSFLYLVRAIATNKIADAFRQASRDRSVPVAELPEITATENEPELQALRSDLAVRLHRLMSTLPHVHQDILALRVAMGLSSKETAKALGMSAVNVRVTQHRAIGRLRALIDYEPAMG
ncbi:sigma-70 family RNA polymerase sigma factor [Amycolatopsis anabasis]|uniref:sigma-70 family RNA polymerase sigma factor n=1 Tax=Amycolatopsis anabasis TaxID=1840409 RepID=UPI00131EB0AB|nr:sigma-70 family RNA polymerase sigma factor [Amycolatopsis anabasis]